MFTASRTPFRFPRRRLCLAPLLAFLLLALGGCESDGPEFEGGETLLFEGNLDADKTTQQHDFTLRDSGTVQLTVTAVAATTAAGEPIADPTLGVSLGRQAEASCAATFSTALRQTQSIAIFLEARDYCLVTFRTGNLTTDSLVDYAISLSSAQS